MGISGGMGGQAIRQNNLGLELNGAAANVNSASMRRTTKGGAGGGIVHTRSSQNMPRANNTNGPSSSFGFGGKPQPP